MPDDTGPVLRLRSGAVVPRSILQMSAVTASGPGGQHVNRSNTAVELRVAVDELPLEPDRLALLRERLANRITAAGELRVEASASRSQLRNRRAAEERLVELIDEATIPPVPRTPTRPSRGARTRARAARELQQQRATERRWTPGQEH